MKRTEGQAAILDIIHAATPGHLAGIRRLFKAYAGSLGFDLAFQNFDAELAGLPGAYAPPAGRLLLAMENDDAAGCVAMRPLGHGVCEMKRLYVKPEYRGLGLGRRLAEEIVGEARRAGYRSMRLDTVPALSEAIALYKSLGFVEIEPYCHNPIEGATFMELKLGS
ncbi:MAG: GNAT family N-acetyltransferase [Patescibacteria group bacterium]